MRVVITGGAGFIGSHLCDRFIGDGHTVVAVDNLITGSENNILHLQGQPAFSFIRHDICQPLKIDGPVDLVLNFASPASPVDYLELPLETLFVGAYGTHNTLELAREKNAAYVLASTSEVYGDPLVHPQHEGYYGNVNPVGPRSVYDEAKRFAESLTMAYHTKFGLNTHIVRIFNTYGPRMRLNDGRVVPNFVGQALRGEPLTVYGDGSQTRSFQYISDLIEGVVRLAQSDFHLPVNIGNPNELTIHQFAEVVNMLAGNTAGVMYVRDGRTLNDPQTRRPDIALASQILGWEPQVSLHDGLARTIAFFEEQRKRAP